MYLLFEILIARPFTALPYSRHFASPTQTGEHAHGRKTKAKLKYSVHDYELALQLLICCTTQNKTLRKLKVSGAYRRTCLLGPAGFYDRGICCSAFANRLGKSPLDRPAVGHGITSYGGNRVVFSVRTPVITRHKWQHGLSQQPQQ